MLTFAPLLSGHFANVRIVRPLANIISRGVPDLTFAFKVAAGSVANVKSAPLAWFARHEIRLAWREWLAIMTGGRRGRRRAVIIGLLGFGALLHLPASPRIGRYATLQEAPDKSTLIVITPTSFL